MKKTIFNLSLILVSFALIFNSCTEDPKPKPTIDFSFSVSDKTVTFTTTGTDVTTYAWTFGDATASTEINPVHTYVIGGEYEVTCAVTGPGGNATVTKTVTVEMTDTDLLAGATGKSWKLSASHDGWAVEVFDVDQSGEIDTTDLPQLFLFGVLLDAEYNDEFTFMPDGTLSVDNKNGQSFGSISTAMTLLGLADEAALLAAHAAGTVQLPLVDTDDDDIPDTPTGEFFVCAFNNTTAAGTWEFSTDDVTVNPGTGPFEVTYSGKYIKFGNATTYAGLYNMTYNQARIVSLTADELRVEYFVDTYADLGAGPMLVTILRVELSLTPAS